MTNDEYVDMATADFTVRLIIGLIFGLVLLIGGIIFAIILLVKKEYYVAGIIGLVAFGGLLVSGINGYILLSHRKKSDKSEQN